MADRAPGGGAETESRGTFDPMASAGLFVGVSTFEDEQIPAVPFAVDDAVDLAHLFALKLGLVLPERTVLLLAGEPRKPESMARLAELVERGACRRSARMRDIYRYLGDLTRGTEERGLFVLTVATHGVSDQGGDFLIATDSLSKHILRTGVAVAEMFNEVARASAGRRLVLLDACRERLSHGTRGMTQSFAAAIAHATGSVVLSGATLGGFAYDDEARSNGVFTAAVMDGLGGAAPAGPAGWITVGTLADFVQQQVATWVSRNRPGHAGKSLGIERRIEATAEDLPLAPHPEAMQEHQRYHARREAALLRVKENLGRVLSGAHWDQCAAQLPVEGPFSPEAKRLLEEIEALDGTERTQRSLRDLLRERSDGVRPPPPPRTKVNWAYALGLVLVGIAVSYLSWMVWKQNQVITRLTQERPTSQPNQTQPIDVPQLRTSDPQTVREGHLWPVRSTLRVHFLDGDDEQKEKFRKALALWLDYANLEVSYGDAADAVVRVSFAQPGSWAMKGTYALALEHKEPSINLGFLDRGPDIPPNYLHEIGHVLGLIHEFKNPQAKLSWNRPAVYKILSASSWTRSQVDASLFDPESYPGSRPFDPESIMMMGLPADFFTDGQGFTLPATLSESDKRYIASLYP